MSLFEHFFKVFSLYLEARVRIWIRIKLTGGIRIRSKVMWIRNWYVRYWSSKIFELEISINKVPYHRYLHRH
jgi:hypothetical protein